MTTGPREMPIGSSVLSAGSETPHHRRREDSASRIFVVEDDALVAMELEERLQSGGYKVCGTADRGDQALADIADALPDLVLLDIRLSGAMNGLDVARELSRRGDIPFVFLSGVAERNVIEIAARFGAHGYLVKPIETRTLYAAIEVALTRHRAEQELRRVNRDLSRNVQIQALARDQAVNNAEQALSSERHLLRNVQHELRTPLQHFAGLLDVLRSLPEFQGNAEAMKWLEHLARSRETLTQAVERVLDLKYVLAGGLRLQLTEVRLQEVVDEAVGMVLVIAQSAGITLECANRLEPSFSFPCDRDRLRQVLTNLLNNAITYNHPNGSVRIEIAAAEPHVSIAVSDTGFGMSAEQLERAFDSFARFVPKGKIIGGIGIGLTVSKQIVEHMGGRIDAVSSPGTGSTFTVFV